MFSKNSVKYEKHREYYENTTFSYLTKSEDVQVLCNTAYIHFEGRIDKKSFQIMINETRPKNLIIVNASQKKYERIEKFVTTNKLNINVCKFSSLL